MRSAELLKIVLEGGENWSKFRKSENIKQIKELDFSEENLSKLDLADLDLSGMDFYRAVMIESNLKMSDLTGSELAEAKLNGSDLYKCNLRDAIMQETDLTGADLSACDCTGADFRGALLNRTNFTGAILVDANFKSADLNGAILVDADVTGADFRAADFSCVDLTHVRYGHLRSMQGKFQGVRGIESSFGNAVFIRDAKDQDYIDTLYQSILRKPKGFVKSLDLALFKLWGLIDHGRSLAKVWYYAVMVATMYGLAFLGDMTFNWGWMDYSNSAQTWFTPFYYSLVTYTTLGYGDVTADSLIGEVLVISEVIVGYFTLGLLLSILANTIARRS